MNADVAWAAGLFDGEGSIGAHFDRSSRRMALQVRLCMTHLEGVRRFREIVGWGIVRATSARPPRRRAWVCTISSEEGAKAVLALLRPYLVVKAAEADVAARYFATVGRPARYLIAKELRALKSKPGNRRTRVKA